MPARRRPQGRCRRRQCGPRRRRWADCGSHRAERGVPPTGPAPARAETGRYTRGRAPGRRWRAGRGDLPRGSGARGLPDRSGDRRSERPRRPRCSSRRARECGRHKSRPRAAPGRVSAIGFRPGRDKTAPRPAGRGGRCCHRAVHGRQGGHPAGPGAGGTEHQPWNTPPFCPHAMWGQAQSFQRKKGPAKGWSLFYKLTQRG